MCTKSQKKREDYSMRNHKKFLAMFLSSVILLDAPVISLNAAPADNTDTTEITTNDTEVTEDPDIIGVTDAAEPTEAAESADNEDTVLPETVEVTEDSNDTIDSAPITEFQLSHTQYTMTAQDTFTLSVITNSEELIRWSSSAPEIASVDSFGIVTAHKSGTAVITAALTDINGIVYSADCTITVKNTISLNRSSYTVYTGTKKTYALKATVRPSGTVIWKSSDTKVATVDKAGKITPKKAGKTTITASSGGSSASCSVTVKKPSLTLGSKKTIYLKNPVTLKAKATPSGKISWHSSNSKIVTVDKNGKVTPKKTGKATISATCNGITKKCSITVKKPSISASSSSVYVLAENGEQLFATTKVTAGIRWKSSNTKVATVDKNGYVTGKKAGTATITAYIPGASAKFQVTVLKNNYKLNFTKHKLITGSSAYLYMKGIGTASSVYFQTDNYETVSLSFSNNRCKITATAPGTANITATFSMFADGHYITCSRVCTIVVSESGIRQQQISLAVKGTRQLSLKSANTDGTAIQKIDWLSANPKIAGVNSNGLVTAHKTGTAKITAKVTYTDNTCRTFSTVVKVSNPKLSSSYLVIAAGNRLPIKLKGLTSYSSLSWKSSKSSLVSVGPDGIVTAAYGKTGKAVITIKADGKVLKQNVIVTNPTLKESYTVMAPKTKSRISLKKINAKSKISYKSSNSSIASVSKSGVVTAKRCGNADITITADGQTLTFMVNVAPQAAVNARNTGYSIISTSTYSQALRMSPGYYDCSSLAFRSYGCNAGLLGGASSWAPTAANMAAYLENQGKVISYGPTEVSNLRPGDLIFYEGGPNGRYRNIYHVSMYYGGGLRLEKPLCYYYPFSNIVMIARPVP